MLWARFAIAELHQVYRYIKNVYIKPPQILYLMPQIQGISKNQYEYDGL